MGTEVETQFLSLHPDAQKAVISAGSLHSAKDPNAVLITRMKPYIKGGWVRQPKEDDPQNDESGASSSEFVVWADSCDSADDHYWDEDCPWHPETTWAPSTGTGWLRPTRPKP